jgi:hypothetical protein
MVALRTTVSFDYHTKEAITNRLIVTDWSLEHSQAFLDRCSIQGKSNMAFKIIPVERKQSLQISILEKFAVCFVAFLIPASALAGLIVIRSASQSNKAGSDDGLTPLQYQKSEHLAHIFKEAACLSHP